MFFVIGCDSGEVLASPLSAWPISLTNDFQFCLPVDLLAFSAQFEAFYASSFNGRNLRWALSHCTAEVRMFCADKPYTLFLAALSAATLLLFDKMDVDELTTRNLALALFPDVSGALSSAERMEMVRRAVMPLVDAGILLLTSSDKQIQAISPVVSLKTSN
ncbi:unnamed protein product [Mesocestoides corti]|uniref:Cullin family profile domain-containing protein n=2 Tax=Mesocestoides corti TaxID=53468 RepID=A0A0R3UDF4_MESCO|nr:unnamed protein product [Mesocestoides corti]